MQNPQVADSHDLKQSAGGHLSVLTAYHLLSTHPTLKLSGLLLHFGSYDLCTGFPSLQHFDKPLILNKEITQHFINTFVPNMPFEQRMHPSVSPYYENLEKYRGRLPPAFFTCGTEDPLLDDSVMMATKWMMAGGVAVLKVYPGAPHGFIGFVGLLDEASMALEDTKNFILEKLEKA
jgi:acetyl esterase/lipase